MKQITCYKTKDGQMFEDKNKAIDYIETKFYDNYLKEGFELVSHRVHVMEFIIKYENAIKNLYRERSIENASDIECDI